MARTPVPGVSQATIQAGSIIYAADGGGTDAYAITMSPAPTAYTTGMVINFLANTINTGNATLNVNGLGAKNILKNHDQTLADGDIEANQIVTVVYDGTQFQMQSQVAAAAASSSTAALITNSSGLTWSQATTIYIAPNGSMTGSATRADNEIIMPRAGTLRNLYAVVKSNSANQAVTLTVYKNGVASGITLTIGSGATGTFSDTTHTLAVAAGDLITVGDTSTTTGGTCTGTCISLEFA